MNQTVIPMIKEQQRFNRRVRAILLTGRGTILFIKRVKPGRAPYYVAPGGGMEDQDADLLATLHRELAEELGASIEALATAFVLEHTKAGKALQEHFFICRLWSYDLDQRHGPEFGDSARGQYIPVEVPLEVAALTRLNIKTPELLDYLLKHRDALQRM